jgi:hypothetical protein
LAGFYVRTANPIVTYVRVRKVDDLSGVGRVGYHFLVTAEHGIKDHLSRSDLSFSADQFSFEHSSIR